MADKLRAEGLRQSLHTLRSLAASFSWLPSADAAGESSGEGVNAARRYWAVGQW